MLPLRIAGSIPVTEEAPLDSAHGDERHLSNDFPGTSAAQEGMCRRQLIICLQTGGFFRNASMPVQSVGTYGIGDHLLIVCILQCH